MRFAWPMALAESRGGKRKGRGITRAAQMNEENAEVRGHLLRAPGAARLSDKQARPGSSPLLVTRKQPASPTLPAGEIDRAHLRDSA